MRLSRTLSVTLSTLAFLTAATVTAQSPSGVIDQVEEDWQLVIATTDTSGVGPQITTCMSPVSDPSQPFAAFDMNYREYPSFVAGGMQIQVWSGNNITSVASQGNDQFATDGETVTWSQRLSLANGGVSFQVFNGQSNTFGNFGQGNQLAVNWSTTATSLADYDPANSVANSGVSWESNLVTSMTLVQVRYYSAGQLVYTDTNPRPITLTQQNSNQPNSNQTNSN